MSVVIKNDGRKEWVRSEATDGLDHDHCPGCDTDIEPSDGFGGEHGTPRMWSQYVHDRKDDGSACGAVWTVTSQQGLERNAERGQQTKWVSTSAALGRMYSLPSKQFEEGWERIYGQR